MSKFFTSIIKRGGRLWVREVDNLTKQRTMREINFSPYLYVKTNNQEKATAKGLRGEPLERMDFSDIQEMENFLDRYKDTDGFKIFGSRDPIAQYIAEAYPGKIDYDQSLIRGGIFDLEVESGTIDPVTKEFKKGPFPEPEHADYPITAATVYDTKLKAFISLGLETFNGVKLGTYKHNPEHKDVGGLKVIYRGFDSEAALLNALVGVIEAAQFDYMSGWNSDFFDVPYMVNRIKKVLGDKDARRLSPWGVVRQRNVNANFGKEEVTFDIYGIANLDYKELVDKHAYVELDDKKLQTAADHFVGVGKIDYEEAKSLTGLYFTNFQKYIEYNIHDVNLIVLMEAKLKFFELVYTLALGMFHCNPNDTMGTVQPWSYMTYVKLHSRGEEPEMRPLYGGETEYLGGYVEEPVPGRYKWGASVDANSLYPSMIQQFNLGVETKLPEKEAYALRMEMVEELKQQPITPTIMRLIDAVQHRKLIHDFYWEDPYEFKVLKERNAIMAPNCTFYSKDRVSVFSEFCREIYAGRKIVKKQMLVHEQELADLKAVDGYDKAEATRLENLIAQMNNLQIAYKIAMNSLYGAMANKWFREYYDVDIAEAITAAGQTGIQYISRRLNEYFDEKVGTKGFKYAFYNDTDSVYVTLEKFVQKVFEGKEDEDYMAVIKWMDKLFAEEIEPLLIEWAVELCDALNGYSNQLIFKREALFTAGVWTAKKRYALMVSNNEGVQYPKPKLKFTGLEAKKSSTPKFCREWLKECYQIVMEKEETDLHARVKQIKAEFMSMRPEQIAAPRGVNNIEKYQCDGFNYIKGTPAHVKAAINHNGLLKKLEILDIKPIVSGDKLLLLPLKPVNPFGFDSIGFQSFLPEEFNMEKYIDRQSSFEKYFLSPMESFIKPVNWGTEPRASVMDFFV